jgi:acyl carrier protein
MEETMEEIKAIIADVLKVDTQGVKRETRFIEDLKADSMDQFFLIDGLSDKYKVTISDDDARSIKTVGDAVDYIQAHKN